MGGIPLRDAAKRFLANLEGAAPMEKLAAENVQKDARISELEATVRDLNDKFNAMIAQRQNDTSQA
jgi:cell division protein FtsB